MAKFYSLMVFIICLNISVHAQTEATESGRYYVGFRGGLSFGKVNASNYVFSFGGPVLYNWGNNFISASFNRGFTYYLEMNTDNSNYSRYEINYGKALKLHETHPLFKYLYFTYSVGLSYNVFHFFEDQDALSKNIAKRKEMVGLPIGLAFTNEIGKSIFAGVELKFHVFQKIKTHGEYSGFIMINIF
ncbi:MAG: hypothetical protein Q8N83_09190 [Ignavibacteria bacterium]|nr:hypothetical protein [Ignavibacteria bacterium]